MQINSTQLPVELSWALLSLLYVLAASLSD